MFKRFIAIVSGIVLSGQLFAVPPSNAIFMSRLKVTGVQGFTPSAGEAIVKFTTHSSSGWEYLMAHSSTDSGDIFKDSLDGIVLRGFNPGAPIDSFTANSDGGGWAFLIAHSGGELDTIITTEWKGTWTQGYSSSGEVVKGFTADSSIGSGDSVWLEVVMGSVGIEESDERGGKSGRFVTGLNVIAPNPCVGGQTRISYTVGTGHKALGTGYLASGRKPMTNDQCRVTIAIYDLSGRLVTTLIDKAQKKPGRYSLLWRGVDDRGRKVATGVYFLRLVAGKFVGVRKLVVIR